MTGLAKTRPRCSQCDSSLTLCMCAVLPRLELRTKVTLVIHRHERLRSSNTGMLARRALVNSALRIRGESREMLDLSDLLSPRYRSLLFYPSSDAVELTAALVAEDPRPIQLIVPDGTWRQARKIHSRHHELNAIPRVKISTPNDSTYQLRAQSRREGMATLLAIAFALGIIEGEVVAAQLMQLYQARVARTLKARGLLPKHSEWELPHQ
ncbi:MAG TPA: tRNA-uridine aminocarboxypropyltransferase [Candidatus Binatia bacterium]|nr:tRNA-uridine aminocarboxypropyltransferase [Candidatus Binatia bacterium]